MIRYKEFLPYINNNPNYVVRGGVDDFIECSISFSSKCFQRRTERDKMDECENEEKKKKKEC